MNPPARKRSQRRSCPPAQTPARPGARGGPGSLCPCHGTHLPTGLNAAVRFSFQKAPERGWLRERRVFSKYRCETTRANHLQCEGRVSAAAWPKQGWGQQDVLADGARKEPCSRVPGSCAEAGAGR